MQRTVLLALLAASSAGAAAITPTYSGSYSFFDLGPVPGLVGNYGGEIFKAGDPNTLLIGANSSNPTAQIDSIGLVRDANGHITGFNGSAAFFASAPGNTGSFAYGPGGVLFYADAFHQQIGEILPGSTSPDKSVASPVILTPSSVAYIPNGHPGAGTFLSADSDGLVCSSTLSADGSGTFNLSACTATANLGSYNRGLAFVPAGSPLFAANSMLVGSSPAQVYVGAYTVDSNGLPVPTFNQFVDGLQGEAEGGVFDPVTGDYLFTNDYGPNFRIFEVRGFAAPVSGVPEPGTLGLGALCLGSLLLRKRRLERE
ncbi:MAG TPA: hypothetical protein VG456_05045 [Candidatus Sulfopaludibacter sp.]|jgi:hypothetical protein|nr:hypothetical protein [Candidatus Sulfopaludibacter sp.]